MGAGVGTAVDAVTPLLAAQWACENVYDPMTPGVFDQVLHVDDDVIGIKFVGDTLVVCPAGSESRKMWEDNAEVLPARHPLLGEMHSGFFKPATAAYAELKPLAAGRRVVLCGHSRGAALAGCLALLFLLDGIGIAGLYLFECPKFGYRESVDFLEAHIVSGAVTAALATENGGDPVPELPAIPLLYFVKPLSAARVVQLDCAPSSVKPEEGEGSIAAMLDDADVVNWHRGAVILAGVKRKLSGRLGGA